MSAIGTKRTSACALHMSAFDPKRTFGSRRCLLGTLRGRARAWLCAISHSPPGRNLLLSGTARLEKLMTMQNDQNRRPGFLENAMGHGTLVVVGDNRGGVCLDGATSFVKCQARPRLALSGHSDAPVFVRFWTKADIGPHWRASHLCPDLARNI